MPVEVKRLVENGSQRNTQDYWEILNKNVVEMKKRPNIVIFNPDEMRWDTLGHMGFNRAAVTPNLDKFAREEAVSFSNAYCQNPVCVPSRCSFLTGLYPHVRGHRTMQHMLHEDESSLFSELKNAGYYVWLNDRNDLVAGQIPGLYESHADEIYSGKSDPKVTSPDHNRLINPDIRGEKGSKFYYSHYVGKLTVDGNGRNYTSDDSDVDRCIDILGEDHEGKPVVAFLGLFYPHCPYGVEEPYFSLIDRAKLPPRASTGENKPLMQQELRRRIGSDKLDEKDWDELRAVYLGMCAKIDVQFKRLCDGLKEKGVYDDTLIVVLSDHGDFAGDYSLPEKAQNTFEDCLVRVPLLIKPPKGEKVDPGITDSMAELVDFYATVMDYAGVESDHDNFGVSLRPVVEDRKVETKEYVFSEGGRMPWEWQADEYHGVCGKGGTIPETSEYWPKQTAQTDGEAHIKGTMVRDHRYKYIKRANGKDEFYDLEKDRREEKNEIGNPLYKGEIVRMKEVMLDWYQKTCDIVPRKVDNRIRLSLVEKLTEGLDEETRTDILRRYKEGLGGMMLMALIRRAKEDQMKLE